MRLTIKCDGNVIDFEGDDREVALFMVELPQLLLAMAAGVVAVECDDEGDDE